MNTWLQSELVKRLAHNFSASQTKFPIIDHHKLPRSNALDRLDQFHLSIPELTGITAVRLSHPLHFPLQHFPGAAGFQAIGTSLIEQMNDIQIPQTNVFLKSLIALADDDLVFHFILPDHEHWFRKSTEFQSFALSDRIKR